jgi:hypothetical protein
MTTRTNKQQSIAEKLAAQHNIDADRILFLNEQKPEEAWLPAESLITIARQSEMFLNIVEGFDQYIAELKQIVHTATVVNTAGRSFARTGVATVDEREDIDDHSLAAGRAVSAALTAAGFNPLRPGSLVAVGSQQAAQTPASSAQADEAASRNSDLRRIHALAAEKGLIIPLSGGLWDRMGYRQFLKQHYQTHTAANFDPIQRASLINALERLEDADGDEFRDVA